MEKLLYDAKIAALGYNYSSFWLALRIFLEQSGTACLERCEKSTFPEVSGIVVILSAFDFQVLTRFFRSKEGHFYKNIFHLCLMITKSKGIMARRLTDMSIIKQVLLLSEAGYSIRKIAGSLGVLA